MSLIHSPYTFGQNNTEPSDEISDEVYQKAYEEARRLKDIQQKQVTELEIQKKPTSSVGAKAPSTLTPSQSEAQPEIGVYKLESGGKKTLVKAKKAKLNKSSAKYVPARTPQPKTIAKLTSEPVRDTEKRAHKITEKMMAD